MPKAQFLCLCSYVANAYEHLSKNCLHVINCSPYCSVAVRIRALLLKNLTLSDLVGCKPLANWFKIMW